MKIFHEEIKEPQNSLLDKINKLVGESFGFNVKCNYFSYHTAYGDVFMKTNSVGEIGVDFFWNWTYHKMGTFLDEDGSSLVVRSKYLKQAIRYSELFEKKFNKEVYIQVTDRMF
ncbi:MAG TPA: hypothetical protein VEC16_02200 [Alphaproteobacteria bacterium]|nr:hypothetical protein [Alphaproteobacteria bacterium]